MSAILAKSEALAALQQIRVVPIAVIRWLSPRGLVRLKHVRSLHYCAGPTRRNSIGHSNWRQAWPTGLTSLLRGNFLRVFAVRIVCATQKIGRSAPAFD